MIQENIEKYSLDLFDETGVNYYGEYVIRIGREEIIIFPPKYNGTIVIMNGHTPYESIEKALETGSDRLKRFIVFNLDLLEGIRKEYD